MRGMSLLSMAGAAMAALGVPVASLEARERHSGGYPSSGVKVRSDFDPHINRHTGRPHEHRREIARNDLRRMVKSAKAGGMPGWVLREFRQEQRARIHEMLGLKA